MFIAGGDEECCSTSVTLIDFLYFNGGVATDSNHGDDDDGDSVLVLPLIGMLKQKFRQQHKRSVAFSNKFELFKTIEVGVEGNEGAYDVRISKSCSLIIILSNRSFLFFDMETMELKGQLDSKYCWRFELEEDYDNFGNDALLTFQDDTVMKYDLKQFITEKENCKPIWSHTAGSGNSTSKRVSVMILNGKKVVVFNNDRSKSMCFLDARTGKKLEEYTLKLEFYIYASFGPDHFKPNTLYLFSDDMKTFEYENGNWKCISSTIRFCNIDGFCMDRVSGVFYIGAYLDRTNKWGIHAFTSLGDVLGLYPISGTGLCIDNRTGLMYVADSDKISILK